MLAIGGLRAYSAPGQESGPKHAQDVWGYTLETISEEDFAKRLAAARADDAVMRQVNQQADNCWLSLRSFSRRSGSLS